MSQPNKLGLVMWQRLVAYFGGNLPRALGLLSIFVVVFAGRFSFDRFLQEESRTPWLELRVWASALAGILAILFWHKIRQSAPIHGKTLLLSIGAFLLFQSYFIGNLLLLGNETYRTGHLFDIVFLFFGAVLITLYFRIEQDWVVFCKITEIFGLVLFLFVVAGFGNPDLNGHGWAPFGGPITFNHLEFFAFCAALYLFAQSGTLKGKIMHMLIGAIALYSTLASLSKIAFAGALIVLLYCFYWLLGTKSYRQTITLFVFSVTVIFCFSQLHGPILLARINAIADVVAASDVTGATDVTGAIAATDAARSEYSFIDIGTRSIYNNELRMEDLSDDQQKRIIALLAVYRGQMTDYRTNLAGFVRSIDRFVVIKDTSDRLRMWLAAYVLFKANPWFGVGIGNFVFAEPNYLTPSHMEIYNHPHNFILDLLVSTGIVGALLFGLALSVFIVLLRQQMRSLPALLFVMSYLFFLLITAMTSGSFFDLRILWLIALAAVLSHSKRLSADTADKEH